MTAIADEFVLLSGFGPDPSAEAIKTREIAVQVPAGSLLIGLGVGGARHLLLPIGDAPFAEDRKSRHVTVVDRQLQAEDGTPARYADLCCQDPSLNRVFEQLVEDVLARLRSGAPAATVCQVALDDWRDLLKREPAPISREKALGLFGELVVLRFLAEGDPVSAVDAWVGPQGKPQDFVSADGSALEVKTLSGANASIVGVSSLEQFDPDGVRRLDLVVVHVHEDRLGDSLDDTIERLLRQGVPRRSLLGSVEAAGYTYGSGVEGGYTIRSCRLWHVDDTFPSLRVRDVDAHRRSSISHVTYDLTLTTQPAADDIAAVAAYLKDWVPA